MNRNVGGLDRKARLIIGTILIMTGGTQTCIIGKRSRKSILKWQST